MEGEEWEVCKDVEVWKERSGGERRCVVGRRRRCGGRGGVWRERSGGGEVWRGKRVQMGRGDVEREGYVWRKEDEGGGGVEEEEVWRERRCVEGEEWRGGGVEREECGGGRRSGGERRCGEGRVE